MPLRLAINGFGRIGRLVYRAILEAGRTDVSVVGINDLGSAEDNAHLLKFDTVHGRLDIGITVDGETMDAGAGPVRVTAERDPASLPWAEMEVPLASKSAPGCPRNMTEFSTFCRSLRVKYEWPAPETRRLETSPFTLRSPSSGSLSKASRR